LRGAPASSGPDGDRAPLTPPEPAAASRRATCQFLRLETGGALSEPFDTVRDDHRCVAIAGPRVISRQQQELVCLRAAHLDCPRYRRGVASPEPDHAPGRPPLPRAVAAALGVLALSAGISLGFIVQRGGIDLPSSPRSSAAAALASPSPNSSTAGVSPTAPPTSAAIQSEAPSVAPSPPPSAVPSPPPTAAPSATPKPTTPAPSPSPSVAPSAPAASGTPSASRLALLKPCPGRAGCYLYRIRSGDNLFSIAKWFGVPLAGIYTMNPTLATTPITPGMTIKIPTPTR
jgi:hypothetical protein